MDQKRKVTIEKKHYKKAYIEITNVCNKDCSFCAGTARSPLFMSAAQFENVLAQVRPFTEYVYLHLMGEPLLHPDLSEFLELCADKHLRVNITTNGSLLKEKSEILLSAPALRKVSVSVHSFEEGTEEDKSAYYHQCIDFAKAAAAQGVFCELRLWNLGGDAARNEAFFALLKQEFGAAVNVGLLSGPSAPSSYKLDEGLFVGLAHRFVWPAMDKPAGNGRLFCYGLRDQFGVLADGTVVPCCLDHEGDISLGNLFETPLEEILQSPKAAAIVDGFSKRKAVEELCRRCGFAQRVRPEKV